MQTGANKMNAYDRRTLPARIEEYYFKLYGIEELKNDN